MSSLYNKSAWTHGFRRTSYWSPTRISTWTGKTNDRPKQTDCARARRRAPRAGQWPRGTR
eukprot:5331713-Alexandrium_andersonii.AAC.1